MVADPFAPVMDVAGLLSGFNHPWFVAGGWAIDLFLDHKTREHEDVDVAILREDQAALRAHLRDWSFEKVVNRRREAWRVGEWLERPVHEIHATVRTGSHPRVEFLLNESDVGFWRFPRNLDLTRPLARIGRRTAQGVPFLAPEIVLLYKAKEPNRKDETDFARVIPRIETEPRRWLRSALEACHPGHPWAARL